MSIDISKLKSMLYELDDFKDMLMSDTEASAKYRNPVNLYPILQNYLQELTELHSKYAEVCKQVLDTDIKAMVQPKPIDPNTGKYPAYIMRDVRSNLGLDEDDTSRDNEIMSMSQNEVFSSVLEWDGIIGYDNRMRNWINDIYGVDLNELPPRQRPQLSAVNDLISQAQSMTHQSERNQEPHTLVDPER